MNDKVVAISSLALVPLKLEAAPLRRKISAALRRAIATGELKPGDRLVEKDLCQELNVSRTSLREALRELQAEKLLVAVPRGLVVADHSTAWARGTPARSPLSQSLATPMVKPSAAWARWIRRSRPIASMTHACARAVPLKMNSAGIASRWR